MSYEDFLEMNPSEAIKRIRDLKNKEEFEGLTKDELLEYRNLKLMFEEINDMEDEFFYF
jgi:uncharacterized protein YnzC (UPF0291/DUF896 family)